jgi:hypothetical protein
MVAAILSADHVGGSNGPNRFQQRCFSIARGTVFLFGGRIHGEVGQHLQQMILHHIAQRASFVVELPTILHAKVLCHGDLDAAYVIAIPNRLEDRIGKAGVKNVLHWLFAQKVVDAKDSLFWEILLQNLVQRLR